MNSRAYCHPARLPCHFAARRKTAQHAPVAQRSDRDPPLISGADHERHVAAEYRRGKRGVLRGFHQYPRLRLRGAPPPGAAFPNPSASPALHRRAQPSWKLSIVGSANSSPAPPDGRDSQNHDRGCEAGPGTANRRVPRPSLPARRRSGNDSNVRGLLPGLRGTSMSRRVSPSLRATVDRLPARRHVQRRPAVAPGSSRRPGANSRACREARSNTNMRALCDRSFSLVPK